mgnify:CR=1 FL=1
MSNTELLIVAMADKCLTTMSAWSAPSSSQPPSLQPAHLQWMCREIKRNVNAWPATKVHRWIGFVQGAMIANEMLSLAGAKQMFDAAKNAFGKTGDDLVDHLDPDSAFRLDIGGQG